MPFARAASHATNSHPLTWLSHMLDCQPFGLKPGAHHLANLAFHFASTWAGQGKLQYAIEGYRAALAQQPQSPEVLNNLAWLLATCPDAKLRDGAEAVRLAEQSCELTRFRQTVMVGTLGAAYAEAGRFSEAVATAEKACALATEAGDDALVRKNQQLLEQYRTGRPYREAAIPLQNPANHSETIYKP